METSPANFNQYLDQLMESYANCLLLITDPWSGNAHLYERMLREVVEELSPSPDLISVSTQALVFDDAHQKVRGSPLLYYLRDGQLKGIIEGIPTRFHLTTRLQLLNQTFSQETSGQ